MQLQLTIVGLPQSGKTTVFNALTRSTAETGGFWTDQLNNPDPLGAYHAMAEEIVAQTDGRIDAFVQSVGTAASLRGVAEGLRRHDPRVRIVAVEPAESPVLSGGPTGAHKIDGVGAGFVVPLWRPELVDRIEHVSTEEAVAMGFAEIQYDYVRFPDEPPSRRASAVYAARSEGESPRQGVMHGLTILAERTRSLKVPFTIDVFGLTTTATGDLGIGQVWEDLVQVADAVLPMVYPSHYNRGEYGFKHPNSEPYGVIHRALRDAKRRSEKVGGTTAEIRPYLQAFTLGAPAYGPEHVRAQIRAGEDLGVTSWVLWNPRSVYERGQLVGREPVRVASAAHTGGTRGAQGQSAPVAAGTVVP